MDKDIFPQMTEVMKVSCDKKSFFHEKILYRYLIRKIEGWSVTNFLVMENIKSYALYAVTDFTTLFLKDVEHNGKYIDALGIICDKNAEAFQFQYYNWPVILPDELVGKYKDGKIEKIIVMSFWHENEIIDGLIKKGVLLNDIISFVSVLYS